MGNRVQRVGTAWTPRRAQGARTFFKKTGPRCFPGSRAERLAPSAPSVAVETLNVRGHRASEQGSIRRDTRVCECVTVSVNSRLRYVTEISTIFISGLIYTPVQT